jgi:hypothetical protein
VKDNIQYSIIIKTDGIMQSVSIWLRARSGGLGIRVPEEAITFHFNVAPTGCGDHIGSYPMGTGGVFSRDKAPGI